MKTKYVLVIVMLLGFLAGREAQAFYNPSAGRWLSRDPVAEKGGLNMYAFAGNSTLARVDPLGNQWVEPPILPPGWPGEEIDCSGYAKTFGATPCKTCTNNKFGSQSDTYPERAAKICDGFKKLYSNTDWQGEAACVARCLIREESACQDSVWCDVRNCCRLQAHVKCYASCAFLPVSGMPEGGPQLGWQELLPACERLGMSKLDILITGLF